MNLLMILLIILGIWVAAAICYFAWQLMPEVESPPEAPVDTPPDTSGGPDSET